MTSQEIKIITKAIADCENRIMESFNEHNERMKDLIDLRVHEVLTDLKNN